MILFGDKDDSVFTCLREAQKDNITIFDRTEMTYEVVK